MEAHRIDGRWIRWTPPSEDAGVQLDAFATGIIWAGPCIDRPTWTLHASPSTPAPVTTDLANELAHNSTSNHPRAARRTARRITTSPRMPTAFAQSSGRGL
ncbi:DUF317 domain-containing protein [Streptomyces asiaticus]